MKGKKLLIVIVAAVLALVAAITTVKTLIDNKKDTEEIINILMHGEGTSDFDREYLIEGEYSIGEKYQKIKDTEKFREKIFEAVQECLNQASGAGSFDHVHKKLKTVESEGLLTEAAVKLIEEYDLACAKEYAEKISTCLGKEEYDNVADALRWLIQKDCVEKSGIDVNGIVDTLFENCQVYSLQNGTGAYYDNLELRSSSSYKNEGVEWMDPIGYTSRSYVEKAYGDFCIGTSHSKTHYEALEGFDFEDKYNTESTSKTLYFRGKKVNGHFWSDSLSWASNNKVNYIICYEKESKDTAIELDGILMIAKDGLYIMGYYGSGNVSPIVIEGDYTDYVKKASSLYNEKFSSETEVEKAAELVSSKKYEEAVAILKNYTHIDSALDEIYTIAVESIRTGNTEFGLETLQLIPYFEPMKDLDMDYMIKNLDHSFDPDVNHTEYTKPFLKLMSDVKGFLTDDEITAALSGKTFKDVSGGSFTYNADGTCQQKKSTTTNDYTWEVKDGKLIRTHEESGKSNTYTVSNVLDGYYLLTYTTENTDKLYFTLLKES